MLLVKVDELGKPKWMGHFLQLGQNKGRLKIHFLNKENIFLLEQSTNSLKTHLKKTSKIRI